MTQRSNIAIAAASLTVLCVAIALRLKATSFKESIGSLVLLPFTKFFSLLQWLLSTMASNFAALLWSALLLFILYKAFKLVRNIRAAKASGLPYRVIPFDPYTQLVLGVAKPFLKLLTTIIGDPSPTSWRVLVSSWWLWSCRYATFSCLGDTFLLVSPENILLYTADAHVISEVISRDEDFPKSVRIYKLVEIYGPNILTTTGNDWRRHRKIVSQAFTEKNNELVWEETYRQTTTMIASWMMNTNGVSNTITKLAEDMMRMSLSVISRAALGQKMDWSWGGDYTDVILDQDIAADHKLKFTDALHNTLTNITAFAAPTLLLNVFQYVLPNWNAAKQGSAELGRYLKAMIAMKRLSIDNNDEKAASSKDMLAQLTSSNLAENNIISNLFIFFVAGHETSANSIHFCLMFLALHPAALRSVQGDLDRIIGNRKPTYRDFPALMNSFLGAVLNEQLRLIAPALSIPKEARGALQHIIIDGIKATIPGGTIIRLCPSAVHRNPKYWPTASASSQTRPYFPPSNPDNDLEEFKPSRWLTPKSSISPASSSPLYVPPRGSYLPFSLGTRACSGQRFAEVEIMCALALILSEYSIELAVDASDEEVAGMLLEEKRAVWDVAVAKANATWQRKMGYNLTFQIKGGCVPVRFVRRGLERFADMEG